MADLKYIERTVQLDGGPLTEEIPGSFYNDEDGAHRFTIHCIRGGLGLVLSGTVSAALLNANNETVPITGSIVSGAARIVLSDECYQVPGRFTLTISVNGAVIYCCKSRIAMRSSSTAYDPSGVINVAGLTDEVAEMRTATAAAEAAATKAVRYDTNQSLTDEQKLQARQNIGVGTGLVAYDTAQTLTDAQKLQARNNIGVGTGLVAYDAAQSLTDAQKAQARANIGADIASVLETQSYLGYT